MANDYDAATKTWDTGAGSCFEQYNQPVASKCSAGDIGTQDAFNYGWDYQGQSIDIPAYATCEFDWKVHVTGLMHSSQACACAEEMISDHSSTDL